MSAYEPSGRPSSRAATTTAASEVLQNSTAATFHPTEPSLRDAAEHLQPAENHHHHHHHRSGTGFRSEHGHHLHSIAPLGAHSGASVVTFFNESAFPWSNLYPETSITSKTAQAYGLW